jgi:hypothetical protein
MARTCLVVDACPTVVVEMAIVTTISNMADPERAWIPVRSWRTSADPTPT